MRAGLLALFALTTTACATQADPRDDLDPELIFELASDQGSATGSAWSGSYASEFTTTSCDCPSVEVEGMNLDLCSLVAFLPTELELTQTGGFLLVPLAEGMLTGAIESDGEFVIAGGQDISSLLGPTQLLGRMDGTLELVGGQARLEASAQQRLIAELAGDAIDCRWRGDVVATRMD